MSFSLYFMTKAVIMIFSLKCESKKSISARFYLDVVYSWKNDRESERSAKMSECTKDDSEIYWFEFVFMKMIIVCCINFTMRALEIDCDVVVLELNSWFESAC